MGRGSSLSKSVLKKRIIFHRIHSRLQDLVAPKGPSGHPNIQILTLFCLRIQLRPPFRLDSNGVPAIPPRRAFPPHFYHPPHPWCVRSVPFSPGIDASLRGPCDTRAEPHYIYHQSSQICCFFLKSAVRVWRHRRWIYPQVSQPRSVPGMARERGGAQHGRVCKGPFPFMPSDGRLLRPPIGRHPRKQGGAAKVQGSYEARLRKALEKREEEVREETP
jgi:hypothetical protein